MFYTSKSGEYVSSREIHKARLKHRECAVSESRIINTGVGLIHNEMRLTNTTKSMIQTRRGELLASSNTACMVREGNCIISSNRE